MFRALVCGGATRALALAAQQANQRSGCRVLGGAARRRMLTCWQGLAGSASAASLLLIWLGSCMLVSASAARQLLPAVLLTSDCKAR